MVSEPAALVPVIVLSMLPISELRGAIPYGIIVSGLAYPVVYLVAVVANILVIPLNFFFFDFVHKHLTRFRIYERVFGHFVRNAKKRAGPHISRFGYIGLLTFVAIPLPITGAYTATMAAWLFGMERKKSFIAISAGVALAGIIVTVLTVTGVGAVLFISENTGEKIVNALGNLFS